MTRHLRRYFNSISLQEIESSGEKNWNAEENYDDDEYYDDNEDNDDKTNARY